MNRILQPELLDELPADDPGAVQSRRDLRRINAIMRNAHFISKRVQDEFPKKDLQKLTIAEIGTGDGNIALQLAEKFPKIDGRAFLIDRQPVVGTNTLRRFSEIGWKPEVIKADVFNWLASAPKVDVLIANLFLHHFPDDDLAKLFAMAEKVTNLLVAAEPRRSRFAPFFARNVWLIGCNEITCHDAEISVRAGFRDNALSRLWPKANGWTLTEWQAGLFTHFFVAAREP